MHVGLVISGDLETLTGGTLYDRILVDDLRRRGHRVTVCPLPAGQGYTRRLAANFSRSLAGSVRRAAPDILIEDGLCHPALFLQNKRLRAVVKGPIVALLHQVLSSQPRPNWQNAAYGLVEKRYLHSVDACIFNSRTTREAAGAPGVLSLIARPAGDRLGTMASRAAVAARAREKGPLRLLFLANVLPHKGLDRLIDALAAVPLPMWRLTVVGSLTMDRAHAQKTKARVAARGLSTHIRFAGARDGPALAGILTESHLLVLPYSHEAFGIVFLEGMAFALPAVGSTAGAAGEIIRHGENGFLVAPRDSAGPAKIVTDLFGDRDRLDALSQNALATFRRYPGWRDTTGKIIEFLKKLAG